MATQKYDVYGGQHTKDLIGEGLVRVSDGVDAVGSAVGRAGQAIGAAVSKATDKRFVPPSEQGPSLAERAVLGVMEAAQKVTNAVAPKTAFYSTMTAFKGTLSQVYTDQKVERQGFLSRLGKGFALVANGFGSLFRSKSWPSVMPADKSSGDRQEPSMTAPMAATPARQGVISMEAKKEEVVKDKFESFIDHRLGFNAPEGKFAEHSMGNHFRAKFVEVAALRNLMTHIEKERNAAYLQQALRTESLDKMAEYDVVIQEKTALLKDIRSMIEYKSANAIHAAEVASGQGYRMEQYASMLQQVVESIPENLEATRQINEVRNTHPCADWRQVEKAEGGVAAQVVAERAQRSMHIAEVMQSFKDSTNYREMDQAIAGRQQHGQPQYDRQRGVAQTG